jgi:hypothetical protein
MVNYTFIDTGPPVHTEQRKSGSKKLIKLTPVSKPPGSPQRYEEPPPPDFLECGNRSRWLLLLIPFCYINYRYHEISPFQLSPQQSLEFYLLFSACCAFTTHLALKAKRRVLTNLLYTEPTAYYLEKIRLAYNQPTNTIFIPLLCIVTGIAKAIQALATGYNASAEISSTLSTALVFLFLHNANRYRRCLKAQSGQQLASHHNFSNLKTKNYE